MAYSENILPKSAAYYTLNRASIDGTELIIEAGGYAEFSITQQVLPKLTSKMLVVAHPSTFSSYYANDAVQVTLSIITAGGQRIEILIPVSNHPSGVFNTEVELPDEEYLVFNYRISSTVHTVVYNWELCAEEAVDVSTVIDGVEQTIPKLLYDFNTYSYAVAQKELTVGLISCFLQSATDLQGHFTISFFATERCNVHVRIKDNNVTELFSPQVYTVEKGYASVSIPHAYLKKTAADHAFSVTMQCSNGQLSIPVRGMLYTIDGGYLATRLLDAGIDIQDISIRQLSTDLSPSEIWAVGFEGNRILLKKRVYSQLQRVNWEAIKDFGEGLKAGVEFHGQWINRNNAEKATINTDINPFVFIIGLDNILRVYTGNSFDSVFVIDEYVTALSACQGFNSMYDIKQDQGLIVAYIKNGNVYYRQWLYNTDIAAYMLYPIEVLYEGGDASFVSVHRLPDYRVGICVQRSSGTKWYITNRTYVSQAVKPEILNVGTDVVCIASVIDASKVNTVTGVATQNEFEEGFYFNGFSMTFDGSLVFLNDKTIEDLKYAIKVSIDGVYIEDLEKQNEISELTVNGDTVYVKLKDDIKGGKTVTISYNFPCLALVIYNNSRIEIQQEYSWLLPLPTSRFNIAEKSNIRVNTAASLEVIPIITSSLSYIENDTISTLAAADINVTEVTRQSIYTFEVASISASASASIEVTLVGVTPI